VSDSPLAALLHAIDQLDVEAVMALVAPDCRLLTVDGRRAEGRQATHKLLRDFLGALHSTKHTILAEWHQDNVWIAEVEADYELRDRLALGALPRMFVVRTEPAGISDVRVYGAHEAALAAHRTGEEGFEYAGRWMPPL
jgi:hypothetical protein